MKVSCAANLRQWASGLHMWASERNAQFMVANHWNTSNVMHIDRTTQTDANGNLGEVWEFFDNYLSDYDLGDTAEGENIPHYCPVGPEIRRPVSQSFSAIGYGYLPNRDYPVPAGFVYTPVDGWISKTKFDGTFSRAPIMFDLSTSTGGEMDPARSSHLGNSGDGRLGSNYLYEDGSVSWVNDGLIDSDDGTFYGAHVKHFRIPVPGIVPE
ncbi:MAG: hypothetical protein WD294_03460 [Phycisphaeraceae bacterium]